MNLLKMLGKMPVIWDGAMGTNFACGSVNPKSKVQNPKQIQGPKSKTGGVGERELVCSEAYNLYAPEEVLDVHKSFIRAGSDVIETNAFNANRISLAEYGLQDEVREINFKAVAIAKEAVGSASRRVLVSGNIGPTPKLPSMDQITFDEMYGAYAEQVSALIEGGVDLIQIETCQDILQAKIATIAANDLFEKSGRRLPVIVTVTMDSSGRMLLGTEPDAVLATLIPLGVDAVGLNCGVGPKGMEGAARFLAHHSPLPILLMPNAGLPEIVGGETRYNLSAEDFSELMEFYVRELGIEMVGGCCGTTPEHLARLVKRIRNVRPKKRKVAWQAKLSSLFSATTNRQQPAPLIIGERMNINGSKRFKKYMLAGDYEAASAIAADQEDAGAHALDVSVAYVGRDEVQDFRGLLKRVVKKARAPLCIDSTNAGAIEEALKMIPGRPIVNSINLEDGGEKAEKVLKLAKRFGAALIALTIDENGMARDADEKFNVARKLINLCGQYGIDECDLFIDPLTFTLAEPRAASFGSGAKTLDAIARIKKKYPRVNTILGVSNISYGLNKDARRVLNSVFLHEAVKAGLDAAIVHAGQILPISRLDDDTIRAALDIVWNRKSDALDIFIKHFEGKKIAYEDILGGIEPREGVRLSILRGNKVKIGGFLEELIKTHEPKGILNDILMPAMDEVGKLFDKGEIPLPFVLQSAEAMRLATDFLSSQFGATGGLKKGKVVLATVRGDVHDIGKNLVDIVLSGNGFEVINLGVKQPVENILNAARGNEANIIGLSGLLVESALIMKDDLAELAHKGVTIPVICGGAALTRKFVEKELAVVYKGPVYYASDAFEGLRIVERIVTAS